MGTFDVRVQLKELYTPPTADFVEVVVPPVTTLAVVGRGDPNTGGEYGPAVEALFTVGYALDFVTIILLYTISTALLWKWFHGDDRAARDHAKSVAEAPVETGVVLLEHA